MDHTTNALPTFDEMSGFSLNQFDLYIHVGDLAYDINDQNGQNGDDYFNSLIPVVTKLPYLPIAGNHESLDDAAMFNFRFRLPGTDPKSSRRNNWVSYDYKNVHFVAIDLDTVYR